MVFSFQGRQHEVHLPPLGGQHPAYRARTWLLDEAQAVLRCLAGVPASHAVMCAGWPRGPAAAKMLSSTHKCADRAEAEEAPASQGELLGTFGQLVEELQACVLQRRKGELSRGSARSNLWEDNCHV